MDNSKIAAELLKLAKDLVGAEDFPYAFITIEHNSISFNIIKSKDTNPITGKNPFGKDPLKAIRGVIDLVKKYKVPTNNVEIRV